MADKTLKATIITRNDTKANLEQSNKVYSKGELIAEIDTNKLKIGNGVETYKELKYLAQDKIVLADIADAGSCASKDVGTSAGNIPILDANGKLDNKVIPSLALIDVYSVDSETAMLALKVEQGDIAVRTDIHKVYILSNNDASKIANWIELETPDCKVISVNGKVGSVVITTKDIAENTNLYYTQARFDTAFGSKNSTDLSDGATLLHLTDTLILDGGNA